MVIICMVFGFVCIGFTFLDFDFGHLRTEFLESHLMRLRIFCALV